MSDDNEDEYTPLTVKQLIELLKQQSPDAVVNVRYRGSTWSFNGEYSEEVDTCEWGNALGVSAGGKGKNIYIFSDIDDKDDFYAD